jgi:hypothetical protein
MEITCNLEPTTTHNEYAQMPNCFRSLQPSHATIYFYTEPWRHRHIEESKKAHVEEGVEERPREPLLEPHHRRLQLPAAPASSSGATSPRAAVPEVIGDGGAGGEPLRPSLAGPRSRRRGDGDPGPKRATPAARAGGKRRERSGGRRRREHRQRRGLILVEGGRGEVELQLRARGGGTRELGLLREDWLSEMLPRQRVRKVTDWWGHGGMFSGFFRWNG